ncbi:nad-dependent 15-hydroxyprostaglandin dehydrogenase [Colletotrichum plurivorum]|uniref:Nad-dependent 15-hydroxyprostaglandin dehydrogenase n=1 Tax=Colletotrichum plurivorum TaxID=2175906 RepID=A0A8H6K8H0_9PEZI|nr:nad-dependent 15-hydroxyprostaglandin dehydrogenase [Colletotrichum plurivorum]
MSSWDVKDKFAIVTGAGSGMRPSSQWLLNEGCSVIFADIALRPEAEATISKYPHPSKDGSPSAVYHKMDQSNWADISATWNFALEKFERIDLLCPGAGIWELPSSAFWSPPGVSPQAEDKPNATPGVYQTFAVNAMGPIRFAQIALDYWLQHKIPGNLIIVGSMTGYLPTIGMPLYNASKGALNAFVMSLAQMRARLGIRVASVCPAAVFTPMMVRDYCAGKVREGDMTMTPAECAEFMMDVATGAEFGNGQVVEAIQFGTKEKSDVRVRVVPFLSLMPDIDLNGDFSGKNILVEEEKLWTQLKTKGMRP